MYSISRLGRRASDERGVGGGAQEFNLPLGLDLLVLDFFLNPPSSIFPTYKLIIIP